MARPIRQLSSLNAVIQRGLAAAEDIFSSIDKKPENYAEGLDLNKELSGKYQYKTYHSPTMKMVIKCLKT